jgi:hypothetical protein
MQAEIILKPGAAPVRVSGRVTGFYPVLFRDGVEVHRVKFFYSITRFGDDAEEMAKDDAETVLRCDPGSLTAEDLQKLIEST